MSSSNKFRSLVKSHLQPKRNHSDLLDIYIAFILSKSSSRLSLFSAFTSEKVYAYVSSYAISISKNENSSDVIIAIMQSLMIGLKKLLRFCLIAYASVNRDQ